MTSYSRPLGCREHRGPERSCCPRLDPLGYLRWLEALTLAEVSEIVRPRLDRVMAGLGTLDDRHLVDMARALWTRREHAA